MKGFKKIIAVLTVLTVIFGLVSCKSGGIESAEDTVSKKTILEMIGDVVNDVKENILGIEEEGKEFSDNSQEEIYSEIIRESISESDLTALDRNEYYCYNRLTAVQKSAYEKICRLAENYSTETVLLKGCSLQDMQLSFMSVKNDNPQYFWLSNAYAYSVLQNGVRFSLSDGKGNGMFLTDSSEDRNAKVKIFNEKAEEVFLKIIKKDMTEYEKELAIHDYICKNVEYNKKYEKNSILEKQNYNWTAYGALVEGTAVCEGYARLFQFLCYKTGINATLVSGMSGDTAHMWNAVCIDKNWYHVDCTSDDSSIGKLEYIHSYFNLTDDAVRKNYSVLKGFYDVKDGERETGEYSLFEDYALIDDANYFVAENTLVENGFDDSTVRKILQKWKESNSGGISVEFSYADGECSVEKIKKDCNKFGLLEKLSDASGGEINKIKYISFGNAGYFSLEFSR